MARKLKCHCCGTVRVINKTSGFIGVDFHKKSNSWRARVTGNEKITHHIGYFNSEIEASYAYDKFVVENKLINRPLNHPEGVCDGY